jgi:putative MFS transporter
MIGARVLSGLALGAYPPLMIAYLIDMLPARQRGRLIMIVVAMATLGPPITLLSIRLLTPLQPFGLEAWRWACLVGGVGALVGGILFNRLPESPRWLFATGRFDEAEAACESLECGHVAGLVERAPQSRPMEATPRQTIWACFVLVGALFFLSPWATVAFPLMSGAMMMQKGLKLTDTLLYLGLSATGATVGTLLSAYFADQVARRTALIVCAAAMATAIAVFAFSVSPILLVGSNFLYSLFNALYTPTLSVYAAELFPTHVRGRATSVGWAINRLASTLAPLMLLPLMKSQGVIAMLSVIGGALIGSIGLAFFFGPPGKTGQAAD